ncbi:hypothetical protein Q8W71_13860 [Methylobacterium sp. NEAU 140]|uniref:hypothetical protein n=1 Tax=Methylobacterium sp. NEAU 140 TaxID=3064945 RepID=UPI002736061A|nr:hypothetical protein [Methylobacterium sp. NEAU 140]MDP4023717.1 hypothetical protein [Methylobacterium sp. NEAU 140]
MRAITFLAALLLASPVVAQTQAQPPAFVPDWQPSIQGTGIPGLSGQPIMLFTRPADGRAALQPTLWLFRDTGGFSGGTPWYTYPTLWALSVSGKDVSGFEWTIKGEQHNKSRLSLSAQNVAVNGTIWREPTGTGEATGPSWALNGNCVDKTGESPPTGACIAAELDIGGAVGPDPNRQRVIAHGAASGQPGSHVGYGYMVSGTADVTIDRAFSTANVGAKFGIGLDLAGGVFGGPAIALAKGQWLAFDADADGRFGRFLGMNPADGMFTYMTPGGPMLRFADDGAAYVGRLIETIPHTPTASTDPCVPGERAWNAAFEFRCIAPNRWRRAALSDW